MTVIVQAAAQVAFGVAVLAAGAAIGWAAAVIIGTVGLVIKDLLTGGRHGRDAERR